MRRLSTSALAAALTLLAAGTQGFAATSTAAAPAPGTWSASGATISPTTDTAPGGAPAVAAAITAGSGTLRLAGTTTAAMAGVRGWIRTISDSGAVAVATLSDAAGHQNASAPLHLSGLWQTFGVTLAHPLAGALSLTLSSAAGSAWPSNTTVEVAGVSLGDTGRSTLVRHSGANYFDLTPFGGTTHAFVANGFDYGPSAIGAEIGTPWEDPTTCQSDAQILGGEGVTMVAAGIDSAFGNDAAEVPDNLVKCADAFWARGIGFGWLFAIQGVNGDGVGFVQEYEQRIQVAIDLLGDHPATYTWLVGNEMNLNGRDADCFFDTGVPGQPACTDPTGGHYLRQLVDYVHSNDSGHPVTTKLAGDGGSNCTGAGAMNANDVPAMDYWSVDLYPATGFGTEFTSCLPADDSTRPALVSEFGQARYYCNGLDTAHVSLNGTTVNYACPPGSHEDDADAQTANTGMWHDILASEAGPSAPSAELLGGTEFMYSDLWWYSSGLVFFGGTALSPANHDTMAVQGGNWYPNGWWAPEWAGVAEAQSAQQAELGQKRVITPEVGAIASMWGTTVPTVSNVSLTPVGGGPTAACEIQVSWTSAQPASTVVSWGQELLVMPSSFTPVHDVESDNTQYVSQFSSSALTTTHSFTIPGTIAGGQGNINPGGTYRISVGGFTSSGAGDMSAGTDVLVPALSCS